MKRNKKNTKVKTFQRNYGTIRNFAVYRCIKIKHSLRKTISDRFEYTGAFDELVKTINSFATGKWTYNDDHFFFEEEQDAMLCRLHVE